MIELPDKLKASLEGTKAFSLNCIVHIYPTEDTFEPLNFLSSDVRKSAIYLSLSDFSLQDFAIEQGNRIDWANIYKPLLEKIPTITESIDLITNKHTISKCTLDISNRVYEDERFSDNIKDLLGRIVSIHFCDNSTKNVDETLLIYTGIIKRYKQTENKVQLELEDMSSVKFDVEVPAAKLPMTEEIREKDRGKPYPMVYGYVKDCPLRQSQRQENLVYVFGNFIADKKEYTTRYPGGDLDVQGSLKILGPYIKDDMYTQNPYLMSNQHYLNSDGTNDNPNGYASVTPYGHHRYSGNPEDGTGTVGPPLGKDFLYVHDEDLIPISRHMLAGLGLGLWNGVRTGIAASGSSAHIECYEFNWNDNTIGFTEEYSEWWSGRATQLEIAKANPLWGSRLSDLAVPKYAVFGRVYRPIKRITFSSEFNYKSGASGNFTGGVKFFGFNPDQNNGGVAWNRTANREVIEQGLLTGISEETLTDEFLSNNIDATTEYQYIANATSTPNPNWWTCWEMLGGIPNDGTSVVKSGSVDDLWVIAGKTGEQNQFMGEFPVHYLQNGNKDYGLFMHGQIHDDKHSTGYANIIFEEYKSSKLKAAAKFYTIYNYNIDILTSKTFVDHLSGTQWPTRSVIGFSGFTHNSKPVSESSAFFNSNMSEYDRVDNYYNLFMYGLAQDTFVGFGDTQDVEAGFPYGPEYHVFQGGHLGFDYDPDEDPQGTVLHYEYTDKHYGAGEGVATGDHGFQEDQTSQFQTLSSLNDMKWAVPAQTGNLNIISSCRQSLHEMYVFQDVMVDDIQGFDFFVSLAGRVWSNSTEHPNDEYDDDGNLMPIQRPYSVIQHMFTTETSSSLTWLNILDDQNNLIVDPELKEWKLSFVIDEPTKFKTIVEDIFAQSLTTTRFETDGTMTFLTHKRFLQTGLQTGDIEYSTIDVDDITKYKYSLTKSEDIANAINIKYGYSNANKKNETETGFSIKSNYGGIYEYEILDDFNALFYPNNAPYSIDYYNFLNEETKKTIEAKYINDENIARKLQRKLLMWYANQHLIINMTLNNRYMNLQVGDFIVFSDLIDNTKAFGFDYTKNSVKNGQLIYNKFIITKIIRDGRNIKVTCIQAHRLELGFPDGFFDESVPYYDNGNITSEAGTALNQLFDIPAGEIIAPDDVEEEGDDTWEGLGSFYTVNWVGTNSLTEFTIGESKSLNISTNLGYDEVYWRIYFITCNYDVFLGPGNEIEANTLNLIDITNQYSSTMTIIDEHTKRLELFPSFVFEGEGDFAVPDDFLFQTKIVVSPTNLDNTNPDFPSYEELEDTIDFTDN